MELNWFTLVAQIVNFLILVWLLKKFLYGPIVSAMQAREDKIRARLENAEDREKEAESQKQEFQKKQEDLEGNKDKILTQAKEEADRRKKELWEQARNEVDEQKNKWAESIEREKDAFLKELRQRMSRRLSDALRKALGDLANDELEQHVISVFLEKLGALDDESKKKFAESVAKEDSDPTVRSAFIIADDKRREVSDAINRALSRDVAVDFQTSEDLISGIEFRAGGRKIAWNVDEYVQDMQRDISQLLDKEVERSVKSGDKSKEKEEKKNG